MVSLKLAHSGNAEHLRYVPGAIAAFDAFTVVAWKFVLRTPEDYDEVDAIVALFSAMESAEN